MARRQRRPADPNEFEDPLSNYEPRQYADDFERFLNESQVGELEIRPFFEVTPQTPVSQVLETMTRQQTYCAIVVEAGKLVGIFSERDALVRVDGNYEKLKDKPIRELMTPRPTTIYETDSPAKALNLMAVGGFRHIPVLDTSDRPVGVMGPRRVVTFLQRQSG